MEYLPDNMTSSQLAAKIAAAKALIQQKVSAFTQSGAQGGNTGGSTQEGSTISAGGYNFVYTNGQWVAK
jgi:hypothetical protein